MMITDIRAEYLERKRLRMREVRALQTNDQRARDAERKRTARGRQTEEQREIVRAHDRTRKQKERRSKIRPFLAIDGEGGGTDDLGRQHYLLMVAADSRQTILSRHDGKPLSTRDCFEFLLSLPRDPILVGYGIGYDATQILRGIKPPALKQILNPPQGKNGPCYTYWGDYAILYQQGQYLRVARLERSSGKPRVVKGSCRTIYETLGFFQCAFVKAIAMWETGTAEERAIIAENKDKRSEFLELTDEIIRYCTLECRHLAELMEKFREVCTGLDIRPGRWSGAGWIASALLQKHNIPKRPLSPKEAKIAAPSASLRRPERDPDFERAAAAAYYGGRFEVSRIGMLRGPVHEYDLHSAYPAAMADLPCPLHTRWVHRPRARRLPDDGLYLARVMFDNPPGPWCALPFRRKGGLYWPAAGIGWYWAPELRAARNRLGTDLTLRDLWVAEQCCECRQYDWVAALYDERRRIGSNTRGYPLKLGLNSLYGKLAQRCGRAPYHDPVAAGLITAITRARLVEAIGHDPDAVVMAATDAVFSTKPLPLDIGEGLGQWEEKVHPDLFIAQPGVYWSPSQVEKLLKSRGAPRSIIGKAAEQFLASWRDFLSMLRDPEKREIVLRERLIPSVPISINVFYGCRTALARGKPWLAGKWEHVTRQESFEWNTKRDAMKIDLEKDDCMATFPIKQSPFDESEYYQPTDFDKLLQISADNGEFEIDENMLLEAMPDYTPFLPHE